MSIKTLLVEEIQDELNDLSDLDLGSEEYKITVDGLTKLIDRAIEMEKFETENEDKIKNREKNMKIMIQKGKPK